MSEGRRSVRRVARIAAEGDSIRALGGVSADEVGHGHRTTLDVTYRAEPARSSGRIAGGLLQEITRRTGWPIDDENSGRRRDRTRPGPDRSRPRAGGKKPGPRHAGGSGGVAG